MAGDQDYYKLILVDDEDEVRGRISSKISKESGFQIVGTAGNGHDALELIDMHLPHVVITDIRMPYIDGLELAGIIKQEYPTIRVAFITGYDQFDYAREAIELGVRSYLTKPLTQSDISDFLIKLKTELDEEFRQNSNREYIQTRYEESLPLLIDNYFSSFLSNAAPGADLEIRSLAKHGITLMDKNASVALIHVERDEVNPDIFIREKKKLLIRTSVKDILLRRGLEFYHFLYLDGVVFVIVRSGATFPGDLDEALLESVQTAEMYHSMKIDIGVSAEFRGYGGLRIAYLAAQRALEESAFLNTGRIAYIEQLENSSPRAVVLDESDSRTMEYVIRFGSDKELDSVIDGEIKKIGNSMDGPSDYRLYMLNLVNLVIHFSSAIGVDITELNGGDVLDTIARFAGPEQMFVWFRNIVYRLRENNLRMKMTNSNLLLNNAISYMKLNYPDPDLNLERTCDSAGISVSYLSLLFKKNIGRTFVKYLTELRLDKAQELLKYSGDRIIEIAEKCGYRDVYYFSHSFKKNMGMSPKKYRENQTAN